MSSSSFVTRGFACPLATMSNACSSGTPAFIIVAICRVKSAMSFSVTFLPPPSRCLRTRVTLMPWRRRVALTTADPPARISPLIFLPVRSRPSQTKIASFTTSRRSAPAAAVAISLTSFLAPGRAPLFVRDGHHLFERGDALTDLHQAGLPEVAHALEPRLVRDLQRVAVAHDQAPHLVRDRPHLVDADAALAARALAALAARRPVRAPGAVELVRGEAGVEQRLDRNVGGLLAAAEPSREPLGGDEDHAGRDVERRDPHVHQPVERRGRVVRVDRREH